MNKIGIMHLIDTLDVGGVERMVVNIINLLPRDCYKPFLCLTRRIGSLIKSLACDVECIILTRKFTLDLFAIKNLLSYIKNHQIQLLHAHNNSLFISNIIKFLYPSIKIIWHDHYGLNEIKPRNCFIYMLLTHRVEGIICVSNSLLEWAKFRLKISEKKICYIPNTITSFVSNEEIPFFQVKKEKD